MTVDRRSFLRGGLALAGAAAIARVGSVAGMGSDGVAGAQAPPAGRFGPLAPVPDENGILLPEGFRSRLVAVGGEVVPGTSYQWHPYPDGGGVFPTGSGGWIYVSNSEVFHRGHAGVGAVRFNRRGEVVDAYRILDGSMSNCSGGVMPWGRWLSGEEVDDGLVWECDPFGAEAAVARPALGVFAHECAVADPPRQAVYLSEDRADGLLYRFRPDRWHDLAQGTLDAAAVDGAGNLSWVPVNDPQSRSGPARRSAPGATPFAGGEGLAISGDHLYLTTKFDEHVWQLDLARSTVSAIYVGGGALSGVDNLVIHPGTNEIFVCEDGGNMELVLLGVDGSTSPFLRFVDQEDSEVTGPAFDPSGTRLYVSSQRAPTPKSLPDVVPGTVAFGGLGRTYEITGPFWTPPSPSTTQPTQPRRKRRPRRSGSAGRAGSDADPS